MTEPDKTKTVIVVGGGWAGLSCAVELSQLGYKVIVLESARQLGGRARRIAFGDYAVDNGQHVLVGAYRQTMHMLETLGVVTEQRLVRSSLDLHMNSGSGKKFNLHLPPLVTPLNLFFGLFRAKGFNLKDRWRALIFGFKLFSNSVNPARSHTSEDMSVAELLTLEKQTPNTIKALWEPICLATLNTTIDEASATIFIRVLHDTFCRTRADSDLVIPKVDLGSLLPDPALDYIESHGGNVHLSKRVTEIIIDKGHVTGVTCGTEKFTADNIVLAIPPHACAQLVKDHAGLHDIAYTLSCYSYNPIVTVYIKYPRSVRLDHPVQGLLDSTSQWIIDRRLTDQPGLMAVVISGPGPHMKLDNDELIQTINKELMEHFPHWPTPDETLVVREKRATFNCRAGINSIRPDNRTKIAGLWLTGDYTKTGYPATLESAVLSGQRTAQQLHNDITD